MSEAISTELPENWAQGQIKDLVTIRNGYAFKSKDFNTESGVPVIRQTNLSTRVVNFNNPKFLPAEFLEEYEGYKINKGDVLIGLSGSIGNLSRYTQDEPALQNQRTGLLVEKIPDAIKYVEYYLQLIKKDLLDAAKGVAVQNISSKTIEDWGMPIAPLEQQKRIVAKIEELFSHIDAGIEALKKAKQLLKQYRQSVLKAAVTGELTKEWREANKGKLEPASQLLERILKERREKWEEQQLEQFKAKCKMPKDDKWKEKYKEPEGAAVDDLPEIPNEWVWATLPQLGELNRGKSKHRPRNDPSLYGGDYPFVQTGDVRAANTWLKEYNQTYSEKGLAQSRLWPKGTMCITIAANIADTAILEFDACFPDSVVGFIPLNDLVNVEVVEFFIRTVKSDLEKYAPATAQKNINLAILETVAIPLLPEVEQEELINSLKYKMSMTDRLEVEIDRQLIKTDKSKQSVLASVFSGQLTDAGLIPAEAMSA